jgi:hypothetical protein
LTGRDRYALRLLGVSDTQHANRVLGGGNAAQGQPAINPGGTGEGGADEEYTRSFDRALVRRVGHTDG